MYFFFFSIVTIVCKSNWDTSPLPHPLSNVGLCNGSVIFNIKGIHITLKPVRLLLFISYWLWVNLYAQRFVKMHSMFNLWQEKLVNRFKSTSTNQLSRFILGKVHTQYFRLPIKKYYIHSKSWNALYKGKKTIWRDIYRRTYLPWTECNPENETSTMINNQSTIPWYWQEEFVEQSRASLVNDHFPYSLTFMCDSGLIL